LLLALFLICHCGSNRTLTINRVWQRTLYRQKYGNPVHMAVPHQATEAMMVVPTESTCHYLGVLFYVAGPRS